MKKGAIGILGGMGPQASAYMYRFLIDVAKSKFNARNNDDFPEIILYSIPIPDFISSLENKEQALKMLKEKVGILNSFNVSCLSIACNTVHMLIPNLQELSKTPFVSMIKEVAVAVKKQNLKKIGLMGSISLINSGIYQDALGKLGIETVLPNKTELKKLANISRNIIAGKNITKDKVILKKIAESLKQKGAEGIILGCTELPMVFPGKYSLPIFNSVEILSMALLRKYYKFNTIRKKL
jgi:aspartate racemase